MGKHSKEKEKKKIPLAKIIIIVLIIVIVAFIYNYREKLNLKNNILNIKDSIIGIRKTSIENTIKNAKSIENEKLVMKSNNAYNKIIQYDFKDNTLTNVSIYEQFDNEKDYETAKNNYNNLNSIEIVNTNDNELSLVIQRKQFGTDENLSYEEIYDKYLVQIVGAYEIIK